jgi:Ca2+-binding EF-hand superfamily protein
MQKKAEIEEIIEENDASLLNNMDNITMSNITNVNAAMHEEEKRFLTIYGLFGVGQTIAVVFASLLLYLSTLTGAKTLHSKMLSNILRNPLSFFDTTPQVR